MQERINELRAELAIDVNALDVDCQKQPQLITETTELLADLKLKAKQGKMNYDEVCSISEKQIREKPETFGISKITESAVKAAMIVHGDVHNAREKMLFAEHQADIVASIVDGYHHRRSMLDNEVKLVLSGLYGDVPTTNPDNNFNRRGRING